MEGGNECNISHLDEGILVPPRKRRMAGFKKQNTSKQSRGSTSASPPTTGFEADAKTLLGSFSSGYLLEEIAESSNKAALAAAKVADTARAIAEEKAAIAAKAIDAAKTALDLVTAFCEESSGRGTHSKKNKSKKQARAHSLHKKHDEIENEFTDENQLRQLMHRSPGFSKHSSPYSDSKSLKQKRLKISPMLEKTELPMRGLFKTDSHSLASFNGDANGSSQEMAFSEEDRGSSLTKVIWFNCRRDNNNIVTQKHSSPYSDSKSLKQKQLKISPMLEKTYLPMQGLFKTKDRGSSRTKLIRSNCRRDSNNIFPQMRGLFKNVVSSEEDRGSSQEVASSEEDRGSSQEMASSEEARGSSLTKVIRFNCRRDNNNIVTQKHCSPYSDSKSLKQKQLKISPMLEKTYLPMRGLFKTKDRGSSRTKLIRSNCRRDSNNIFPQMQGLFKNVASSEEDRVSSQEVASSEEDRGSSQEMAFSEEDRGSSLTKVIWFNCRRDNNNIVTQKHSSPYSDSKSLKQKQLKISPMLEKTYLPMRGLFKTKDRGSSRTKLIRSNCRRDSNNIFPQMQGLFKNVASSEEDRGSSQEVASSEEDRGSSQEMASSEEDRGSSLTKVIRFNWVRDNNKKRKARKQLIKW